MKRLVPISFAFLFMALTSEAFSRPSRPSQIPNGGVFSCANCHVNPAGGGDRNVFGSVVESGFLNGMGASATVNWNAGLAALDSDGDGATNGEELGDPDGDGVPVDGAVVTNPADSASTPPPEGVIRVLSFTIAGQELAGDASNPPVDAGDQEVVIRFAEPVAFELSEDGSPVFDNLGVGFAPYLGIGEEVTNLSISGDGRTLTATVSLAENTAYQVLVGPTDLGSFDEPQVYYVGTSELPDVSITGRAIYPEDLAGRAGEGLAVVVLLDRERYELLQEEGQGFNPAMVKILAEASASRVREEPEAEEDAEIAALVRMTGIGSGGRYELKFVPDGDYILLATVVLDDGEVLMAGSYGAEDLESGSAPLLVEGVSLTDVDVDLFHIGVDIVDAREVTVAGVDVKGGFLYFDDSDGDRVTVSVFPILGSILDLEGNLIEFSDLGVGSVVLVSGLMVVGEIVAFEIRVVSLPPSPEPPSPDFSGNGVVGLEDFFAFAEVYGSVDGDGIYQAKFDLSRNGSIGLEDFFIFAESFGMEVGTSSPPPETYTPLAGLRVSNGRVQFLFSSAGNCIKLENTTINGVVYTAHTSKWQRKDGSSWVDISSTEREGLCSYSPTSSGEYRLVSEISVDGVRGKYTSENTLTVS